MTNLIVLVGRTAAGKSTLAQLIAPRRSSTISASMVVRELVGLEDQSVERVDVLNAGVRLLRRRGARWFARMLRQRIERNQLQVLDGPRPESTVKYLRRFFPRMLVIHVAASHSDRVSRLRSRGMTRRQIATLLNSGLEKHDESLAQIADVRAFTRGKIIEMRGSPSDTRLIIGSIMLKRRRPAMVRSLQLRQYATL